MVEGISSSHLSFPSTPPEYPTQDQINKWISQLDQWKSQFNDPNNYHDQVAINLANEIEDYLRGAIPNHLSMNEIMSDIQSSFLGGAAGSSLYLAAPGITQDQVNSLYSTLMDGKFSPPPPCTDVDKLFMQSYDWRYQVEHQKPPVSQQDLEVAQTISEFIQGAGENVDLDDLKSTMQAMMNNSNPSNPFLKASPDIIAQFKKLIGI